jgi:hypothetical protein
MSYGTDPLHPVGMVYYTHTLCILQIWCTVLTHGVSCRYGVLYSYTVYHAGMAYFTHTLCILAGMVYYTHTLCILAGMAYYTHTLCILQVWCTIVN